MTANGEQQNKIPPVVTVIIIVAGMLVIALLVVLVLGYIFDWDWTGLGPYIPPTKDNNFQRGKTLWDWLQLLIIPVVLAVAGFWLNQIQKDRDKKAEEAQKKKEDAAAIEREELERKGREDNQREAALQTYIDKMSELLLKEHLGELTSGYKDEGYKHERFEKVRNIARVRTLTTLHRLDADRKYSVLQLLYEAHLIDKGERIVDLDTADLRKADLRGAQLEKANLWGTKLQGADLSGAHLKEADLKDAALSGANLSEADLRGANLTDEQLAQVKSLQGATMPDGSIHP